MSFFESVKYAVDDAMERVFGEGQVREVRCAMLSARDVGSNVDESVYAGEHQVSS